MKDQERFWRNRISKEILKACEHEIDPCVECSVLAINVRNGWKFS